MKADLSEVATTAMVRDPAVDKNDGRGSSDPLPQGPRRIALDGLSPFCILSKIERDRRRPEEDWGALDRGLIRNKVQSYLLDRDWRVRNVGVKLVGLIGFREMLGDLLRMLRDRTPDTFVRRLFGGDFRQVGFIRRNIVSAVGALGVYGPEIKSALMLALEDPYYEVRACAASTIRRLADRVGADPELEGKLLRCLRNHSFEVLMECAHALGRVGGEDSVKPLLSLFSHRNWRVREAAMGAAHDLIERGVLREPHDLESAMEDLFIPCPSFRPTFPLRGGMRNLAQDLIRLKKK